MLGNNVISFNKFIYKKKLQIPVKLGDINIYIFIKWIYVVKQKEKRY